MLKSDYILLHIIGVAKSRDYKRLSLKTGSQDAFKPVRQFYAGLGFQFCKPFEGYKEDPSSVFIQLDLN